jgi:FkbM family methyltransferase
LNKVQWIKGAIKSRVISALGKLGVKVSTQRLVEVLGRQYGESASIEAFSELIKILQSLPTTQHVTLLIPDDMRKALSFVKYQVGNPDLICLSNARTAPNTPNLLLLKTDFLFQAYPLLKSCNGFFLKHFENAVWLILADRSVPGGTLFSIESLDESSSEAMKTSVYGFGETTFSVRPGTNDYQIVSEVASSYLPAIRNWLENSGEDSLLRVIDLGGHIGSFSVQVNALLSGNCEIHIYEPEPSNFAQIKKNIELNNAGNIKPFNLAVSSVSGQNTLYFNPEHSGAHQLGSKLSYDTKAIPVEVVTLESVFSKWDSMPIDILKIDVEGSEYNALFPAPELVNQCHLIVGEAQRNKDRIPQDMIDFLKRLGFSVTFSGDAQNCVTFSAINERSLS